MIEDDTTATNTIVAEQPDTECSLCHDEIRGSLEDHLVKRHTHRELAALVVTYHLEQEESGAIQ